MNSIGNLSQYIYMHIIVIWTIWVKQTIFKGQLNDLIRLKSYQIIFYLFLYFLLNIFILFSSKKYLNIPKSWFTWEPEILNLFSEEVIKIEFMKWEINLPVGLEK